MSSISMYGTYGDFEIPNSGITIYHPQKKSNIILENNIDDSQEIYMHFNDVFENIHNITKKTFMTYSQ